jgi:hypothetical protein
MLCALACHLPIYHHVSRVVMQSDGPQSPFPAAGAAASLYTMDGQNCPLTGMRASLAAVASSTAASANRPSKYTSAASCLPRKGRQLNTLPEFIGESAGL